MTDKDEDLIKKRAYALWESQGRPEGRHDEHWSQAYKELSSTNNTAVLGEPTGPEDNAAPVDKPAKAEKSKAPLSVLEGGAAGNPGAKRKRKTV